MIDLDNLIGKDVWQRIPVDSKWRSRHVIHYMKIHSNYETALAIAKKLDGKKYRSKHYGGGIVFQVPRDNLQLLSEQINKLIEETK